MRTITINLWAEDHGIQELKEFQCEVCFLVDDHYIECHGAEVLCDFELNETQQTQLDSQIEGYIQEYGLEIEADHFAGLADRAYDLYKDGTLD